MDSPSTLTSTNPFTAVVSLENAQENCEVLKSLSLSVVFFALAWERLFFKTLNIEIIIRPENNTVSSAFTFQPELLQAGAVKGLILGKGGGGIFLSGLEIFASTAFAGKVLDLRAFSAKKFVS